MVSERVLCRRFVGRDTELGYVGERRRVAAGAHGGGIVVLGEAGIGKSRLIREYRDRFGARALIATGVCREFGQRAFEPLAEILAQLAPREPHALSVPAASKEEQLATILAVVERATAKRFTTIVVEDVHWAQPELLQTLAAVTQWAAGRRLLLLFTCRDAEVPPESSRFTALARLARETATLRLEPLGSAALGELIEDALAGLGTTLPRATVDDVRRRAGGNPLFTEELLRHAVDARRGQSVGRSAAPALPLSLQGVIRERLGRCAPREREFLSAASVLGPRFRLDVIERVFGLGGDDVVAALSNLIALQLVDRTDDPRAYEFRHALARDVVYGDLVPAHALQLHRRVAETVEAMPDAREHAELLAFSFRQAALPLRAAPYCETAGDHAVEQYAYEDAVAWFERAAEGFGERARDVGRVLGKASIALNRLGEPKRAAALYERAIAAFAGAGDVEAAVRMCTFLGGTLYNDARTADAFAAYRRAAELAERAGSDELRLHVQLRMFALLVVARDVDGAARLSAEIDESRLDPDSRDTFEYYLSKTTLHALNGEGEPRRIAIARAFASCDRRSAPAYERRFAHGYVAVDALAIGDVAQARHHAALGLAIAQQIHSDVALMLALLADAEAQAGDLSAAREHLSEIAPSPDFVHRHARALAAVRVALAAGDDALLRDAYVPSLIREAEEGGNADAALELVGAFAAAARRLERTDEARALAERFARELTSAYGFAWQIAELGRLFPAIAPQLRVVIARRSRVSSLDNGVCALLDALLAGTAGEHDRRVARAGDGAAIFAELGIPLSEARCREAAGELAEALAIYRRIAAVADVRRLERSAQARRSDALSPREREVALLVAAGKNNRDAAHELGVTLKAVEKCLTSVYRKLGLSSRSQLAAYVTAHGIEPFRPPSAAGQ